MVKVILSCLLYGTLTKIRWFSQKLLLCFCKPVIGPWALRENTIQSQLANQSRCYIGYQHKPYNNNIQLSPKGEVNSGGYIPRGAKCQVIYPPLFTDPEGDSWFSIYQIRWIKNATSLMATISSSETFAKRRAIFLSVRKTVNSQGYSELQEPIKTCGNCYPLIW